MHLPCPPYVLHDPHSSVSLIWSPQSNLVSSNFYKALVMLSSALRCHLSTLTLKDLPQHPILKQPPPRFLLCERGDFTHMQNRQNYSYLYLDLNISWQQTARQKFMHQIIANISSFQCALGLFLDESLISEGYSQIPEMFHPLYILWYCPACWSRDITLSSVFSAFYS